MNTRFPAILSAAAIRYGLIAALVSLGGVMALSALNASMGDRFQDVVGQGARSIVPVAAATS